MTSPIKNDTPSPSVLILHHDSNTLFEYQTWLEEKGFQVFTLMNGTAAIRHIYETCPDLIIGDIHLPEINGYQICRLIKHDPYLKKTPVILVSSELSNSKPAEKLDQFWGFKAGADDFIHHHEAKKRDPEQLVQRALSFTEIYAQEEAPSSPLIVPKDLSNIRTRLTQILDKSLIEKTLMVEFRNLSDLIHDKNLLSYMVFTLLESLVEYELCALFFNDKSRDPRIVSFHIPPEEQVSTQTLKALKTQFFNQMSKPEAISRQYDIQEFTTVGRISETNSSEHKEQDKKYDQCYYQEFFIGDELIGSFAFYNSKPTNYKLTFPIALIEDELKLLMKLRYLYSQAEMLAITDGLTGLFNYRHLMLTLDREFKRAKRYKLNFAFALIDIDHFKNFNDKWGHLIGDDVLKNIAQITTDSFRNVDFVARYGGEEIAVIFPETSLESAVLACERFREAVASTPVEWQGEKLIATVSIGVSKMTASMETPSDLIREADNKLYEAKRLGRNRVVNI